MFLFPLNHFAQASIKKESPFGNSLLKRNGNIFIVRLSAYWQKPF